ncbi:unnamed protein product, partial [Aphanomyces euteiches]
STTANAAGEPLRSKYLHNDTAQNSSLDITHEDSYKMPSANPHTPSQYAVPWWTTRTYSENKDDVTTDLQNLLDNWIPPTERTQRPEHLSTLSPTDLPQAPRFVREWLIHDMDRPEHIAPGFIHDDQCTWETYTYTSAMQQRCDRHLRKHVAPGYGGVSQELWIAAPPAIRERERLIINTILRTGCVPHAWAANKCSTLLNQTQPMALSTSTTAYRPCALSPSKVPLRADSLWS